MNQLTISEKKESNYTLYDLVGALTFETLDIFRIDLYEKVAVSNVVLDLSEILTIDSAGIGLILAANTDCINSSHTLYLLNPSECVEQGLSETGLNDLLKHVTSITEIQ